METVNGDSKSVQQKQIHTWGLSSNGTSILKTHYYGSYIYKGPKKIDYFMHKHDCHFCSASFTTGSIYICMVLQKLRGWNQSKCRGMLLIVDQPYFEMFFSVSPAIGLLVFRVENTLTYTPQIYIRLYNMVINQVYFNSYHCMLFR